MDERLNRRHALMNTDRLAWFHVKPGVNRIVRQGLTCLHNACARPRRLRHALHVGALIDAPKAQTRIRSALRSHPDSGCPKR